MLTYLGGKEMTLRVLTFIIMAAMTNIKHLSDWYRESTQLFCGVCIFG